LVTSQARWKVFSSYSFTPSFYKYSKSIHLYQLIDGKLAEYPLMRGACSRFQASYANVPYQCRLSYNENKFIPVDVQYTKKGISIVGEFFQKADSRDLPLSRPSLQQKFLSLHPSLQKICSKVNFPNDNGEEMMNKIVLSNNNIFGASDASLKNDRASHAWIISSGDPSDIDNPNNHISGSGLVHGYYPNLSSARGELHLSS
jgi:hypothetical protein